MEILSVKEVRQILGLRWSQNFSKRNGFTSHEFREIVVSHLHARIVSTYFLYEITRHSVPEISEVVAGYVRPNMDELRDIIE